MRTDSVKKYVIPNIPYLFILWACLKLGTAYRLAPGADFAHKLMGLGQSIGPAFADFAPGLAPFDWLIGIVGAVGFRLLIYFKSKNAKKFRRDEEYGSARWGTEKDIKPFVDPKFENNVILTKTEFLTMNTRPKNPANARNLNACIIGSSGSGKTRFWLTPQLLQAHSSYVCVDPKGGVLSQVGAFLQRRGYKVKVFNSIDFSKSMHYNPLAYVRNEADIKPFVDPKFENNIILTGTEFLTMNTRPKNPANARNLNACVIGSSGSGKTRFWLTPQLLQAHSSYVVVDPKGGTLAQCGYFLQKKKGYKVKVFNSIDFSKSMHYNPMAYIKTESDVLKFVNALIANTKGDGKEGDEFWTSATRSLTVKSQRANNKIPLFG